MLQHSMTLYLTTVLIWGSTFYAIKFQLGTVAVEVSIAYRFILAALLILAYCAVRGRRLRFTARDHAWMALQGLMLFGANYLLVYLATSLLTSGLIALLFSSIIFMNIALSMLLFRRPIEAPVVAGALLGLTGIGLVFWPELTVLDTSSTALRGVGLALLGTLVASFGNMVSVRNQGTGLPIVQTNGYGMGYGGLLMALWAVGQGLPFSFEPTLGYSLSLVTRLPGAVRLGHRLRQLPDLARPHRPGPGRLRDGALSAGSIGTVDPVRGLPVDRCGLRRHGPGRDWQRVGTGGRQA